MIVAISEYSGSGLIARDGNPFLGPMILSTISLYVKTRLSIAAKPGFSGLKNHGLPGIPGITNPGLDSLVGIFAAIVQ